MVGVVVLCLCIVFAAVISIGSLFSKTSSAPEVDGCVFTEETATEPMDSSLCNPVDFYLLDEANLLTDDRAVIHALESFYQTTGVQPCLLIVDNVNGETTPKTSVIDDYATQRYIELFGSDEGHLLLFYMPYRYGTDAYYFLMIPGVNTEAVFSVEASDYMQDVLDSAYSTVDTVEKALTAALEQTTEQYTLWFHAAQSVTPSPGSTPDGSGFPRTATLITVVIVCAAIVIVVLVVVSLRKKNTWNKDSYAQEKQQTAQQNSSSDYENFNQGF